MKNLKGRRSPLKAIYRKNLKVRNFTGSVLLYQTKQSLGDGENQINASITIRRFKHYQE